MPNAQKVLSMLDRPWRRRGQLCVWLQPYALSSGAEALGASLSQSERAISFRNAIHEWLCAIPAGGCLASGSPAKRGHTPAKQLWEDLLYRTIQ
jgi:hypothetical protein